MENNYFSKNLENLRKQKGLSVEECANLFKISEKELVSYEIALKEPSLDFIIMASKFFNVDATDFVKTDLTGNFSKNTDSENFKENVQNISGKNNVNNLFFPFRIFSIILSTLSIGLLIFINIFNGINFFDLLTPESFSFIVLLPWAVFAILVWNIVDNILMFSSKTLRHGTYGKVSNTLNLVLNYIALILWLISISLFSIFVKIKFLSYWLVFVLLIQVIFSLLLRNKNFDNENKKLNKNEKKFLLIKIISLIPLLCLVLFLSLPIYFIYSNIEMHVQVSYIADTLFFDTHGLLEHLLLLVPIFIFFIEVLLQFINVKSTKAKKVISIISIVPFIWVLFFTIFGAISYFCSYGYACQQCLFYAIISVTSILLFVLNIIALVLIMKKKAISVQNKN